MRRWLICGATFLVAGGLLAVGKEVRADGAEALGWVLVTGAYGLAFMTIYLWRRLSPDDAPPGAAVGESAQGAQDRASEDEGTYGANVAWAVAGLLFWVGVLVPSSGFMLLALCVAATGVIARRFGGA